MAVGARELDPRSGSPASGEALGFDARSADRWARVLRATLWRYFRPEVLGSENLPDGRALIVGCHSGVVPYDAACLFVAVREATGRFARFIGDDIFGRVAPVERFLRRQGAVVGRPEIVEELLSNDELVLLFPGGALDMTRPYLTNRYRVLAHRGYAAGNGGYIKAALRTGSPIVPLAVVGTEEIHVMLGDLAPLARLLRLPLVPVVASPLPLPTKIYLRFGQPIRLTGGAAEATDQPLVDRLNETVRRRVQALITDTVRRRQGVILSRYRRGLSATARGDGG